MMHENFLSLLRCALWGGQFTARLTEGEWMEVWTDACNQSVWAVLYDVVGKLPEDAGIPELILHKWAEGAKMVEERNAKMRRLVDLQKGEWDKLGIKAVQLKGLTLAGYYPVPDHRLCGDIDWWFPEKDDWEKAFDRMAKAGANIESDSDGDIHYRMDGIIVEHHRKGFEIPGREGELLLLVDHIFHHAAVSGIGIRQFCDLALAYAGSVGQYDPETYVKALKARGLFRFANLVHAMLRDCLGLDTAMLPFPVVEPRKKSVEGLAALVFADGSFSKNRKSRPTAFFKRVFLLGTCAPAPFVSRWFSLTAGRLRRVCNVK